MGLSLKMKVSATNSALNLLSELQEKYGEKLMFHQSGGCCDGSAPMCFQEGEFPLGDNDLKLGEIGGVPFYMNADQFEKWKHTDLTIDAVDGDTRVVLDEDALYVISRTYLLSGFWSNPEAVQPVEPN